MNELSSLMAAGTQSLADSISSHVSSNKSDNVSDFSSVFKQANQKQTEKPVRDKKNETKPAEELVAYASATQNINNANSAQNTDKSSETSQTKAVTETQAADANQTESAGDVQDTAVQDTVDDTVVTATTGDTFTDVLLSMADTGESDPQAGLNVEEFLAAMVAQEDEQLGAIAQTIVQNDADITTTVDTQTDIPEETQVTTDTAAEIETAGETEETAVTETDEPVDTDVAEDAPELVVPEEEKTHRRGRHDHSEVRQSIRDRIAAWKVGHKEAAGQISETDNELPVEETGKIEGTQETEQTDTVDTVEGTENEEKSADKKTDTKDNTFDYYFNNRIMQNRQVESISLKSIMGTTVQDIVNQLVEAFRTAKLGDGTTMLEMQLQPEHLGKISILIASGEDGLSAQIKVPGNRVENMLSVGLTDLMSTLKEMGVNMKNIEVTQSELNWDFARGNMSGQDQKNNGGQQENQQSGSRQVGAVIEIKQQMRISSMLYGSLAMNPIYEEETSVEFRA